MKRFVMTMVFVAVAACLVGCEDQQSAQMEQQQLTPAQQQAIAVQEEHEAGSLLEANLHNGLLDDTGARSRRYDNIQNLNTRMLVDDWDRAWLFGRSSMLTPYIVRVGY